MKRQANESLAVHAPVIPPVPSSKPELRIGLTAQQWRDAGDAGIDIQSWFPWLPYQAS